MNAEAENLKLFEKERFARSLGIRVLEVKDGYARVEAKVRPKLTNLHGFAHGGLLFALADTAFALSVNVNRPAAAVQFSMSICRPTPVGETLTGESTVMHNGRSHVVVALKVTDSRGNLVASGQATALPVNYGKK